jgi:hypothetical protein
MATRRLGVRRRWIEEGCPVRVARSVRWVTKTKCMGGCVAVVREFGVLGVWCGGLQLGGGVPGPPW